MLGQMGWGLQITVVGMGLVFALLALLWGLLTLVLRFDPAPAAAGAEATADEAAMKPAEPAAPMPTTAGEQGIEPDLLAAITIAVLTHRAVRRREAAPAMRSYWPGSLLYASRWVGTGRARQNYYWRRRGR